MTGKAQMQQDASLTAYVANFVSETRYDDIPEDVMRLGKKNILDGLACALAGAKAESSGITRRYLAGLDGEAGAEAATLIGTAQRATPRFAALANGTAMHADDYDDTLQAETGRFQAVHPTSPVLPAVLAAAESAGRSGRDLLTAYHVGVETACRIFDATDIRHILNGFHGTGTCGMLGAAAGVANLYGLDTDTARMVLGIAASQSCGLQANFGTMMKPMQAGRSAEGGIAAADLGRLGFTASPIILESSKGFYQAEGGGFEEARLRGKLGKPWSFVDRGVWLKPWPTGSLGHPAMTITLELITENNVTPDQMARLRVRTSENIHATLFHHSPNTLLEAKFSLEFCLAALLLQRGLGLTDFTYEFVARADLQQLISLIDYGTFLEAEGKGLDCTIVTAFVEIDLKDGRTLSGRADYGKGSKANPMSEAEVTEKFRDCAAFAEWDRDKTNDAIEMIWRLEAVEDVRRLSACLAETV
jgi:2-methylcitrate dehydratase PrpD